MSPNPDFIPAGDQFDEHDRATPRDADGMPATRGDNILFFGVMAAGLASLIGGCVWGFS